MDHLVSKPAATAPHGFDLGESRWNHQEMVSTFDPGKQKPGVKLDVANLVGGFNPSEKHMESHKIHVPNHQPATIGVVIGNLMF